MMSDAEASRIVEWNRTAAPPPCACVHELFEAQVAHAPTANAAANANTRGLPSPL